MEYVDPHHKRTEFTAESFSSVADGTGRRITFVEHGQQKSVVLVERGSMIFVKVPEVESEIVLSKAQILEKSKWLTLDLKDNPLLRRIVVHIDHLNVDELDADLKALIGAHSLLYFRRHI